MYKNNAITKFNSVDNSSTLVDKKYFFKEILCPLTKNPLLSSNCFNCQYCQKIIGKHISNRTLTTLICLFNPNKGE